MIGFKTLLIGKMIIASLAYCSGSMHRWSNAKLIMDSEEIGIQQMALVSTRRVTRRIIVRRAPESELSCFSDL